MYFLATIQKAGKTHLRALGAQTYKRTGQTVRVEYPIKTENASMLTTYGIGTKFVVDDLKEVGNFYEAVGEMKVLLTEAPEPQRATKAQWTAYGEYMKGVGKAEPNAEAAPPEAETYFSKMRKNKALNKPTLEDDGFYVSDDIWYMLMRNIGNNVNTMLVGATGSGKTALIQMAHKKRNRELEIFDMAVMQDPIAGLLGVHRLKAEESRFEYARHVDAIKRDGSILYDELSRAPQMASNILFPVLDDRRTLYVDVAGTDDERVIKVHPECALFATANEGSTYTGTFAMDRALKRRFMTLEIDYPPIEDEVKVYLTRLKKEISETQARKIVAVLNTVRESYKKGEISDSVSVGEGLVACELVRDGLSVQKALEVVLFPLFEGTAIEGERGIVSKMITSRS